MRRAASSISARLDTGLHARAAPRIRAGNRQGFGNGHGLLVYGIQGHRHRHQTLSQHVSVSVSRARTLLRGESRSSYTLSGDIKTPATRAWTSTGPKGFDRTKRTPDRSVSS